MMDDPLLRLEENRPAADRRDRLSYWVKTIFYSFWKVFFVILQTLITGTVIYESTTEISVLGKIALFMNILMIILSVILTFISICFTNSRSYLIYWEIFALILHTVIYFIAVKMTTTYFKEVNPVLGRDKFSRAPETFYEMHHFYFVLLKKMLELRPNAVNASLTIIPIPFMLMNVIPAVGVSDCLWKPFLRQENNFELEELSRERLLPSISSLGRPKRSSKPSERKFTSVFPTDREQPPFAWLLRDEVIRNPNTVQPVLSEDPYPPRYSLISQDSESPPPTYTSVMEQNLAASAQLPRCERSGSVGSVNSESDQPSFEQQSPSDQPGQESENVPDSPTEARALQVVHRRSWKLLEPGECVVEVEGEGEGVGVVEGEAGGRIEDNRAAGYQSDTLSASQSNPTGLESKSLPDEAEDVNKKANVVETQDVRKVE